MRKPKETPEQKSIVILDGSEQLLCESGTTPTTFNTASPEADITHGVFYRYAAGHRFRAL